MDTYDYYVERTDNGYSAYVPDLPGCIAAAKTYEETENLIRESIEFHIAGLQEDGLPVPAPSRRLTPA